MKPTNTARWTLAAGGAALALVCAAGTANAATWSVASPPYTAVDNVPYAPLAQIAGTSASNAWGVGGDSGTMLVDHWNGSAWTQSAMPSGPCNVFESSCQFTGVSADPSGDAIAVGNAVLNASGSWLPAALAYQWTGKAWQAMPLPSTIPYMSLDHVKAFSPTNAWAVGAAALNGSTSETALVTHWDGTAWTQYATPFSTTLNLTMGAISGDSASDIWIAGEATSAGYSGTRTVQSVLERYNGSAWTEVAVPDESGLVDVDALSPTSAWALATDGSVLHYNGTAWTVSTQYEVGQGEALAAVSPTDVWVAGVYINSTLSLAHYNGSSWSTTTVPASINEFTNAGGYALSTGAVWFAGLSWPPNGDTLPAVLSTTAG
ncbi:MAG TPA: hypothetical protein VGM10_35690 [Actinocrinis sp.]|jgi:hypothetical protein